MDHNGGLEQSLDRLFGSTSLNSEAVRDEL